MRLPLILALAGSTFAQELVRVPIGSHEVTDQITSVKLSVSVSEFLIGATEVTQKDYQEITGTNPSVYKGADRPVENVSWWDAIRYCNLRSIKEKLSPCYDLATGERNPQCSGYRLPTESEWIRAAGKMSQADRLLESANLGSKNTKSVDSLNAILQKGTTPVRSLKPNELGLYDTRGNVWEWCGDFFDSVLSPDSVRDPAGPLTGIARIVRGGSFTSTTSGWSRDFRSSMSPKDHSRFTGFRVVRSSATAATEQREGDSFFDRYNQAPKGFESSAGPLTPLLPSGTSQNGWPEMATKIRSKWNALIQEPKIPSLPVTARLVRQVAQRNFTGEMMELQMEPDTWEKIYILRPRQTDGRPLPVLIVPFYDVDVPAAMDLGGRNYTAGRGVNAFAYTAAQHGYIAVAVRWFGESYGESYSEAVANLAIRHPGSTGLGKWVADARRVVDFIETLPGADTQRIGIMGHSLGGKMALYAAALEPRIRVAVFSELGIGFKFSNYDDYWYLGDRLASVPAGTDQHELLALLAPRPALLIGGDEYDKNESWYYINAARPVYQLFGKPKNIGYFNHHSGHTPSPDSISAAFRWLDYFLQQ